MTFVESGLHLGNTKVNGFFFGISLSLHYFCTMKRWICFFVTVCLLTGCSQKPKGHPPVETEVLNRMTPVKNQGKSQTCWIYAMLAAIETERLGLGDSVNLSAAYVEYMLKNEQQAPESKRGMGIACIYMIHQYGLCGYDAYRKADPDIAPPKQVFMGGAVYTPHEFARSVCAPDEYIALTSNDDESYNQLIDIDMPDNWEHNRFWNIPMDTLLAKTERAVRQHHGVCWESKEHAMAIVGLARDAKHNRYFIMKNSWGDDDPDHGLIYMSYDRFRKETLAVEMTKEAYIAPQPQGFPSGGSDTLN